MTPSTESLTAVCLRSRPRRLGSHHYATTVNPYGVRGHRRSDDAGDRHRGAVLITSRSTWLRASDHASSPSCPSALPRSAEKDPAPQPPTRRGFVQPEGRSCCPSRARPCGRPVRPVRPTTGSRCSTPLPAPPSKAVAMTLPLSPTTTSAPLPAGTTRGSPRDDSNDGRDERACVGSATIRHRARRHAYAHGSESSTCMR
jgi:hypothetical protein